jgi:hypothetical protein
MQVDWKSVKRHTLKTIHRFSINKIRRMVGTSTLLNSLGIFDYIGVS